MPPDPPPELIDLAFFALDHGTDSVLEAGGDLVPFTVTEADGQRTLRRFVADRLEEGVNSARNALSTTSGVERAALAFEGYLTFEGGKAPAVIVEAFQAGEPEGMVLVQRHSRTERIGNPALLGSCAPLF